MAKRHYGPSYYEGRESHMKQEREDGAMLNYDYNAIANMPQEPKMVLYPKSPYDVQPDLDDRMSGIQRQMKDDEKETKRERYPEKY